MNKKHTYTQHSVLKVKCYKCKWEWESSLLHKWKCPICKTEGEGESGL